jgi:hypothetical protein
MSSLLVFVVADSWVMGSCFLSLVQPSGFGRSVESASSSVIRNGVLTQVSFLISGTAGLCALFLRASVLRRNRCHRQHSSECVLAVGPLASSCSV